MATDKQRWKAALVLFAHVSERRWWPWCSFCWSISRQCGAGRWESFTSAVARHG